MALMFTFLLLYYTDNYYNILHDKRNVFVLFGTILVGIVAVSLVISFFADIYRRELLKNIKREMKSISLLDVIVLAFAAAAIIASWYSEDFAASITGEMAWDVGCGVIVIGTVLYFVISRWYSCRADIWAYFYVGSFAVVTIGVIDRLGYDFLIMHDEIPLQYNIFISTIGNVNFWSAFLSMVVPFFILAPLFIKSRFHQFLIYLFLMAAYVSLFITLTNTTYVGIGVALLFIVYFSLRRVSRIKNLAVNGILFSIAGTAAEALWKNPIVPREIDTDTISLVLLQYKLYLIPGAAGIILIVLIFIYEGLKPERKKKIDFFVERILPVIWLVLIALGVEGVIFYLVNHYSLELFNYRGSIWYFSFQGFLDGNILQKIIGVGPGLLDNVTQEQIAKATFEVEWDWYYCTAHNDVLEYLVTMGAVGALLRIAMYILPYFMLIKGDQYKKERAALLAALTGFIGQGLITGPYILTYAIYFVLLGAFGGYWRKSKIY